jgi:hypothetical protein
MWIVPPALVLAPRWSVEVARDTRPLLRLSATHARHALGSWIENHDDASLCGADLKAATYIAGAGWSGEPSALDESVTSAAVAMSASGKGALLWVKGRYAGDLTCAVEDVRLARYDGVTGWSAPRSLVLPEGSLAIDVELVFTSDERLLGLLTFDHRRVVAAWLD